MRSGPCGRGGQILRERQYWRRFADDGGQQEISFESDDTAWQFKPGGRYDFSERWFVDAAATYLMASGVRMALPANPSQTIESDYGHLTLSLGVGWRF